MVLDDELQGTVDEARAKNHDASLIPTKCAVFDGVLEQRLKQELRQRNGGGLRGDIPFEAE
jgi:hypothetical protein